MTRLIVEVKDMPSNDDYTGQIEVTWRSSRPATFDVRSTTGVHQHQDVEDFIETETFIYRDAAERKRLLRLYAPN